MKYSIPKGTYDILPIEEKEEDQWRTSEKWQYLEKIIHEVASQYGYSELRTPFFEQTDLFIRGVGLTTDIVGKEMYTFLDKAERSMTLRPEGTAPFVRAYIENHLDKNSKVQKFYYIGPMFRYDRPQAGRYRQFHQFGVEAVGCKAPEQDVEIIDLLYTLYSRLGLRDLTVLLNTVGDEESRLSYQEALRDYLKPHFQNLSPESQNRFEKNPLRILDSKDETEIALIEKGPKLPDFLTDSCKEHFEKVKNTLSGLNIPYLVHPRLVRGLDYYNKTVFEITAGGLGTQNSIVGGGRYDGLIALLGGPDLPAVGFATGLERVLQSMRHQECYFPKPSHPFVFFIPMGDEALSFCFKMTSMLRKKMIPTDIDLSRKKIGTTLQKAHDRNINYVVVFGDNEIKEQAVTIKDMKNYTETKTDLASLSDVLTTLWKQYEI